MPEAGLATEDPVDAHCVGQDDRNADDRNDQHDAKCLLGGGSVVDREAVTRVGHGHDDVREITDSKHRHEEDHGERRHQEGSKLVSTCSHEADGKSREDIQCQNDESPRTCQ